MRTANKKLNLIDLFAGCGGLTDGFEQTNKYNTIACIEWETTPCKTLIGRLHDRWNYSDAAKRVIRFDIQRTGELMNGWEDDELYGANQGLRKLVLGKEIHFIVGGPPCQAYSVAGRIRDKNGMKDDYRNYLFESYLRIVEEFNPLLVIFENVPGMLNAKPGGIPVIERIKKAFNRSGYEIVDDLRKYTLINCAEYGVPQLRKRVILVALNKKFFKNNSQKLLLKFYNEIMPEYKTKKVFTVRDAISNLPKFTVAPENYYVEGKLYSHKPHKSKVLNHVPRYHNKRDIGIFRELAVDFGNGREIYKSAEDLKRLYKERTGKSSNLHKYHVLNWNKPSNTIPAHLHKDGLRHIHPDFKQARSITVREAARLQSFDDNFVFLGGQTNQYKMIGNAVPPLLAKFLAEGAYKLLNF